ncbi:phloretin 4'-O-glucosyltransferase [Medicago truncatula]|uniref:Glycosyltransferase n=1 Tax=Medicago truncatula TaxID=3880 RepID=G7JAU1_MEDTR|nr:phloretin 4'-O-glucosyltransferase [Medicago truncatula]AES71958.1 flavonoid glucosyltransferase [Medicago truncatula]
MAQNHHFLIITYPLHGHINPALQFAKRLISFGAQVTFATTIYLHTGLINKPTIPGLSFATFSDGYDDGKNFESNEDFIAYRSELKCHCSEFLTNIILSGKQEGRPFTCLAYGIIIPWVAKVARELHLPSALLWIQAATVFDIYYYYFHEHGDYITNKSKDETCSISLPGLSFSLESRDLPSFLLSSNIYTIATRSFKEQIQVLDEETNPTVLVNTVEEFELEALKAVDVGKIKMIPIGPLIPYAFLGGKDPNDTSSGGGVVDVESEDNYFEWLDSKDESSVVYVSFGTLAILSKRQMEEIGRALLDSGFYFLWVIRDEKVMQQKEEEGDSDELSCREELERNVNGKIVKWCSQVEVLSHRSLGCFMTHCGWNSTLESLGSGVPMVAFPQWTDQTTNAKLIEDLWKTGLRVERDEEAGIVKAGEIMKCLEVVMGKGEKGEELRRNAKKWKSLASEAMKEGGSSNKNLSKFLDDIGCISEN